MQIKIDGIEELKSRLNREKVTIDARGKEALRIVALNILADAKENLKSGQMIATGALRNSGRVNVSKDVEVEFRSNYAAWVEFGRKAGRMPPVKMLEEWVKKKGIADSYTDSGRRRGRTQNFYKKVTQIAFLIARKIALRGTKPKPFLYPAFRANESKVIGILKRQLFK